METEVFAIPILRDNYVWVLRRGKTAIAIDPGEAVPVRTWLEVHGLDLVGIVITHHHFDHTGGVAELRSLLTHDGLVVASADAAVPQAHVPADGDELSFPGGTTLRVLAIPGHTRDHLAYLSKDGHLYPGDTLFSMGVGRLFEGRPEEMVESLARLKALDPEVLVHPAHEYTAANLEFALDLEPMNTSLLKLREDVRLRRLRGEPTLPVRLSQELAHNPFLRLDDPAIRRVVEERSGCSVLDPVTVFATLRSWKDRFASPAPATTSHPTAPERTRR